MNPYNKYFLPRFLNWAMQDESNEAERLDVVAHASGVVLEIGFGSGLNLPFYKNITKLYALDPSQELYNLADARVKATSFPIEYIQASAEKIPLEDNTIDTVVSTWSLCSIPNPALALKEVARVLKPSGKFIFIEHGKSPKKNVARLQKWLTPLSKLMTGGCHLDREMERIINNENLEVQNLKKFEENSKPFRFMYKGVAVIKARGNL